jgi:hypothetical protein
LGDKQVTLDTRYAEQRVEAKKMIEGHLKAGAAIFVEINGDDYRIEGYDDKKDELVVRRNQTVNRQSTFRFPGLGTKLKVVPQRAGG